MANGEIIKDYNDDQPYPSKLLLGFIESRPIHLVVAQNAETQECIIITCYGPDDTIWENDFKNKR